MENNDVTKIAKFVETNLDDAQITELLTETLGEKGVELVDIDKWKLEGGQEFTIDGMMLHIQEKLKAMTPAEREEVANAVHMGG